MLDYSIKTVPERKKIVEQYLAENPNPTKRQLDMLADYLVLCMEKEEKKERKILTPNRATTINKREIGLPQDEALAPIVVEDKNIIFQPREKITKKDIEEIPFLAQLIDTIKRWEEMLKTAEDRDIYIIKHALIEMRKDQYLIKKAYKTPIQFSNLTHNTKHNVSLPGKEWIDANGTVHFSGFSFLDKKVISYILCNYSRLKEESWDCLNSDAWFIMQDFDKLADKALKDYPIYNAIVEAKIDGLMNQEIMEKLQKKFSVSYSSEQISYLWRNRIPKVIAEYAMNLWIDWHYTFEEKGTYKKCSRCGEIKLAIPQYFSRNKTSKDGLYSLCKECKNKRGKK